MLLRLFRELARLDDYATPAQVAEINSYVLGRPFEVVYYRQSRLMPSEVRRRRSKVVDVLDRCFGGTDRFGLFLCGSSGLFVASDDTVRVEGRIWSREAAQVRAVQCVRCRNYHTTENILRDENGQSYCSVCIQREHTHCDEHNVWHLNDHPCVLRRRPHPDPFLDENRTPSDQWPQRPITDTPLIMRYSTNVLDVLGGFRAAPDERLPSEPLWLGVELEVEPRLGGHQRYTARTHKAVQDFAILKHDGSLRNDGFEIVTVPGTLAWHLSGVWEPFFEKAAPHLRSWTTETCGLHVHLNRHALTNFTIGKMLVFVHKPGNAAFIARVAGRGFGGYNTTVGDGMRVRYGNYRRAGFTWDHHWALGFSNRNQGKTLELRIFRGNCGRNGLYRALEFTQMLTEFATQTSAAHTDARDFVAWFQQPWNYARYPHFKRWARKNNVLTLRSKLKDDASETLDA